MKTKLPCTVLHLAKVAGLALGISVSTLAQSDLVINTFDTEESIAGWSRWWGGAAQSSEFDPSVDASGNASSGSLKATIDFDATLSDNQFALVGPFPGNAAVDGTEYSKLTFDMRWASESPQRASGDFGYLEPGFRTTDWAQIWLTGLNVTPGDEWIRVELPINPGLAKLDIINGIVLKMWSGQTGLTGQSTFWVDNVKLVAKPNTEIPNPTLALERPQPGLRLNASASGIYQRQNIRTTESDFSWVGADGPVSYSFTITDYPSEAGFQSHIFLVPGSGFPNWESAPDWNRPDVIFLDISNNAQGGGSANFRYKVNAPNANSMIYNANPDNGPVGALGAIGSATIKGTWTLTFNDDTTAVVTTSDGSSMTYQLPAEHAALFAGPLHAFFGVQPNGADRLRKTAVFRNVKITGVQSPIDESFPGVAESESDPLDLDTAVWTRVAENAAGITLIPSSARYELVWSTPAAGFVLQSSPNLVDWSNVDAPATQISDTIRSLLSTVPSPSHGFFRLVKP